MTTLALLGTAACISIVLGIPLGMFCARRPRFYAVIRPIMDFMQTMPAFVFMIPVIAFLGPAFAGLLSGSFVVETIFQIPGLGRFYVQAAFNRDYTMILGTTVFLSTLIVVFNLLSDVLAAWMNPRLRAQFGAAR